MRCWLVLSSKRKSPLNFAERAFLFFLGGKLISSIIEFHVTVLKLVVKLMGHVSLRCNQIEILFSFYHNELSLY